MIEDTLERKAIDERITAIIKSIEDQGGPLFEGINARRRERP